MTPKPALALAAHTTLSVVAQTREETDAVLAFNDRMRAAKAPADFLLPDEPNNSHTLSTPPQAIQWTKFVVVDNEDDVHGGFQLMTQPAWLNGGVVDVANYQAPSSEGIVDSCYGAVDTHMLGYVQKHWPYTFVVGMGGMDRPLPRLLLAAGWQLHPVPFLFHDVRASRAPRGSKTSSGARDLKLERIDRWDDWADRLWAQTRDAAVFSVIRDRGTLECLYPLDNPTYLAYTARQDGQIVGWAVAVDTRMHDHECFGNLRVATVLDAVAMPQVAGALVSQLRRALAAGGVDLIVTNQTHEYWIEAFSRAGFLGGPSNYLVAMSTLLSESVGDRFTRIHVTRGDGDGRVVTNGSVRLRPDKTSA
jgi:hypothetical protein